MIKRKNYFWKSTPMNSEVKLKDISYKKDSVLIKSEKIGIFIKLAFFLASVIMPIKESYQSTIIPFAMITAFIISYFILPRDIEKHLEIKEN